MQLSFEPAFAGWVPPQEIRLGRSLSRHTLKIETPIVSVGSKPSCGITRTAGQLLYTIKYLDMRVILRTLILFFKIYCDVISFLRIDPLYGTREWNSLANVVDSTNPGYKPLNP